MPLTFHRGMCTYRTEICSPSLSVVDSTDHDHTPAEYPGKKEKTWSAVNFLPGDARNLTSFMHEGFA